MNEKTQIGNTLNKPMESKPEDLELSSPTSTKMKNLDRRQFLDTIAASLFAVLKISIFTLLLLAMLFIFVKIYTQEGVVILPFETSKNEDLSGIAIADQLTSELIRIQQIHAATYEDFIIRTNSGYSKSNVIAEQSLGNREIVAPKAEIVEFNMVDIGDIDIGIGSMSIGKLMIVFKNICPGSKPIATIRGSLQRYGSNVVLVALLESSNVQSWMVRRPIDNNNEEQLQEMIRNLAFMIAHDLRQSDVSAKTWEGLENYTEALDAYHQYKLSGNPNALYLASNYSLDAIRSEKGYKNPYALLSSLEYTYIMIGRQSDAAEYCNKTIELDPRSAYGWYNKGGILNGLSKHDEAIKAYDEAITYDPQYSMAWNNKGFSLSSLGKYDEAIEAYNKAIDINPKYAGAWYGKGFVLAQQGKYDEAIQAYNEAITINPQYESAWKNKGNAFTQQGKYDEAIKAYNKAIEINPQYESAWYNKGFVLAQQGKYDMAIQAYNEAITINPQDADAWCNKGVALGNQGKYNEAIKAYDEAIGLNPEDALAWYNKGIALEAQGNYTDAIKCYDEAIRLYPHFATAWNNKGTALKALGRTSEADAAYAKAKELGYTG